MPQTQRVLSGSRTKGSTATPSGSIIYSYQGINARTTTSYFGSLLPRIGSGDRLKIFKDGNPISEKYFDDESTLNNDVGDLRAASGSLYETRLCFDLERMTFGQAPTTQQGEPYADIMDFEPVAYLNDPGETMWPVNLWNAGSLPDHEFDGVIEPFDIRRSILGEVDLRFEGHAPRGALMGPYSENPFGSTEITDTWKLTDKSLTPFFDGPNQFARDRNRDLPVLGRMTYDESQLYPSTTASFSDPNSVMPLQGYQGLERELIGPMVQQDFHDIVYSRILNNNPPTTTSGKLASAYNLNVPFYANGYRYLGGVLGWWRFNETSFNSANNVTLGTTITNSSLNSLDGTIINVSEFVPANAGEFRVPNGFTAGSTSIDFNGIDSIAAITGSAGGAYGQWDDLVGGYWDHANNINYLKSFSAGFWVRQDDMTNSVCTILNIGAQNQAGSNNEGGGWEVNTVRQNSNYSFIQLARWTDDGDLFYARTSNPSQETGLLKKNIWMHIVCTCDLSNYTEASTIANCFKIYINGESMAFSNTTTVTTTGLRAGSGRITPNKATIGSPVIPAPGEYFPGQLVDLAIWNRALSHDEIRAWYNATQGGPEYTNVTADPMTAALQALNGDSCEALTSPLEKRATRGFYFGEKAGSIVYGDW